MLIQIRPVDPFLTFMMLTGVDFAFMKHTASFYRVSTHIPLLRHLGIHCSHVDLNVGLKSMLKQREE